MNKQFFGIIFSSLLIITTCYGEDVPTPTLPFAQPMAGVAGTTTTGTQATGATSPSTTTLDNIIKEFTALQNEKDKMGSYTGIETSGLPEPYPNNKCGKIDRNNLMGAAMYWLCTETLTTLNKSTVSVNQNANNSLVLTVKQLTFNSLYLIAKLLFAAEDIFSDTHKTYLPTINQIYKDNLMAFNTAVNTELTNSLNLSKAVTSDNKTQLTLDLGTNTPDPNSFINTASYNQNQLKNADLIKRLLSYYPSLPKEVSLTPYQSSGKKYLLLENFNKNPPEDAYFPVNKDDLGDFQNYFSTLPELQDYQVQRSAIILSRLLYFSSIMQSYLSRKDANGLAAAEFKMATEPLKPEYANKIATATLATLLGELLRSVNNGVYFMYRVEMQNERLIFMQAMSGMLMGSFSDVILSTKRNDIMKKMSTYYCGKDQYKGNTYLCPKPAAGT